MNPRTYFQLVLVDNQVLTLRDPWPGPDGKPMLDPKGRPIDGEIWQIAHQQETVVYETDDDGQTSTVIKPERYMVLMRARPSDPMSRDFHGIKNAANCEQCKGRGCSSCPEETQVFEIPGAQVKRAVRIQDFDDAVDQFHDMIEAANEDLIDEPDPDEEPATQEKTENGTARAES